MGRSTATLGAAAFLVGPGISAGLIPWWITGWDLHEPLPYWFAAHVVGVILICGGLVPVVHACVQFAKADGTPMPLAPTQRLVVSGFNRHVRNPMYVGLLTVIVGQSLLFGQFSLLVYAVLLWAVAASVVRWYEEPTLHRQFGAEYDAYQRAVPAWRPRLHPWAPNERSVENAQ